MGYTYGVRPIWETRPDSIVRLREMLDLKMSAARIGDALSNEFGVKITRNMVCGKASRLGLMLKGKGANVENKTPKAKPKNPHKMVFYVPRNAALVGLLAEPIAIPTSRRVQLIELTFNSCRWPIGDPRHTDFGFCGAGRVKPYDDSNAYCAAHAVIAYRPIGKINLRPVRQANSVRAGVQA
jgi:GcrA cell cycle regulator